MRYLLILILCFCFIGCSQDSKSNTLYKINAIQFSYNSLTEYYILFGKNGIDSEGEYIFSPITSEALGMSSSLIRTSAYNPDTQKVVIYDIETDEIKRTLE